MKENNKSIVYICQKWQGWKSCAITTLGRGGSDLTATIIGKALGLREIQVCLIKYKLINFLTC
jgi:aspartokinase